MIKLCVKVGMMQQLSLAIKEKYFSYDATLFTKIDVEVELGKVLLTGVVPFGDMRLEAVTISLATRGCC